MADKMKYLDLEFQGFKCSPIFEVTRSAGYDPDFSFVHIARADLGDPQGNIVLEDPAGPGGLMQALQSGAQLPAPGRGKLFTCGDLVVKDQDEDGKGSEYRIARFLLSENSLSAVEATDGSADGLIRVELSDVRKLWEDLGVVFVWTNIPARTIAEATAGTTLEKNQRSLVPGSTDGGKGKEWTLRRVLEVHILPNLPGRPKLNRLSKALEGKIVGPHKWDGVRTKVAMQELLSEFDALPVLELDNSVSVWKRGDGPLQDVTGKPIEKGKNGVEDARVASRTIRMSHRVSVPDVVVVLGRSVVETRSLDLVAVGEDKDGNLVRLDAALKSVAQIPNLAELLTLPHEVRAAMGVSTEGLRRVERWAYKWYAPKAVLFGQPSDILPFEDLAETDTSGQGIRMPPVVMAESITSVRVNKMQSAEDAVKKTTKDPNASANEPALRAAADNTDDTPDKLTASGKQGVVVTNDGAQVVVHPDVDSYYVLKNLPMSTQQSGSYEIDRKRGVVMFATPRVQLAKDEVPPLIAQLKPAAVRLIVGVEKKPSFADQLSIDFRYSSAWKFKGTRDRESLDLKDAGGNPASRPEIVKIDPKADPVSNPLSGAFVIDTDLQMLKSLDGRTNRDGLDAIAKRLAEGKILANRFIPGAIIELVGFVPIIPTGRILSVVFRSNDGLPQTIAHDGQPADLRAAPKQLSIDSIRKNLIPNIDSITTRLTFLPGKGG